MSPDTFHRLARRCSGPDTVHYGYSMNWQMVTYGMNMMDYGFEMRADIIKKSRQGMTDLIRTVLSPSVLFHDPLPTNPYNTSSYILGFQFRQCWVDHWEGEARKSGSMSMGYSDSALYNPLACTGSLSVHLCWTYDPHTTFSISKN